jgi:spore coat protein CotH
MKTRRIFLIILFCLYGHYFLFAQNIYHEAKSSASKFYDSDSIREIRITFKQTNWDHILDSLFQSSNDKQRLICDISIDGHKYYNTGARFKGYSSWSENNKKNPFDIFINERVKYQNYQGYTQLRLANVTADPSFIREVLAYEIARKYLPEPEANFANVYVNDTLIGLYTNVESVNDEFIDEHYNESPLSSNSGISGDWDQNALIKGHPEPLVYPYGDNANLIYYSMDSTAYYPYFSLESTYGWSNFIKFVDILNNDTANLSSVLNIDRTLWMHAINYSLLNLDSYIGYAQNFYVYQDNFGRFNPIMWDLNMSFGSFRFSDATTTNLSIQQVKELNPLGVLYSTSTQFSARPLITNILSNSTYRRMFIAHMRTILNDNIKNGLYYSRGKEIQTQIQSYVQSDTNKFFSYSYFVKNIDTTVGPLAKQYPGIKNVMEAHAAYLDSFTGFQGAPVISGISHHPLLPQKYSETWISAKVTGATEVSFAYRFQSGGPFQKTRMFDDGNHNDGAAGDSIYGAAFQLGGKTIQYYIYAQNDSAAIFAPERAEYDCYYIQPEIYPGDLAINEIQVVNNNTAADQNGEYNPWIELMNLTSEDMHLSSLYLTDDKSQPAKWAFPDTVIKAKSFIIVWADNDVSQQGLHAGFNLSSSGGNLFISYTDGKIVDSLSYNSQTAGKTIGRYPNGYGQFVYMIPTFNKNNYCGTTPQSDFLLYPNPANGKLYLEYNNRSSQSAIEIWNAMGQEVKNIQYNLDNSIEQPVSNEIDISQLNKGMYCLKLTFNDQTSIKKFIVY